MGTSFVIIGMFLLRIVIANISPDSSEMFSCFTKFDKNNKTYLSQDDFYDFVSDLLTDRPSTSNVNELFAIFDLNADDKIDEKEFEEMCKKWVYLLKNPVTALLVIDVQNDFIDGTLAMRNFPAKQEGAEVVPIINKLLENIKFDAVAYSRDYHPNDHISFFDNLGKYKLSEEFEEKRSQIKVYDTVVFEGPPQITQKLWPKHCVEGSWGVDLHANLKVAENAIMVNKGYNSKIDSYSAFYDNIRSSQTKLQDELNKRGITHVFVCGIATDYCVGNTALDATRLSYATSLVLDASRGIDTKNIAEMLEQLRSNSGVITSTDEVLNIAQGKDIKSEFAMSLARRGLFK